MKAQDPKIWGLILVGNKIILLAKANNQWTTFLPFCSNEELTLETSNLETLHGGRFTLSTQLVKPKYITISLYQFG